MRYCPGHPECTPYPLLATRVNLRRMSPSRAVLTPRLARVLGVLFFLFLLLVIAAADAGRMPPLLRRLYDFPQGDRLGHVILFGLLAFLLVAAFPRRLRLGRVHVPAVTCALVLFATAEELSQSLFSTRTFDPIDLICSIVGVLTGTWAALRLSATRQ